MNPLEMLKTEHRVIEQVLSCLEPMIAEAEQQGKLAKEPAADAVAFFRTFADKCHHGKEEVHLFPALEARGFSPDSGPTAVMRTEHNLGRTHVRGMAEAIDPAATGDGPALASFISHARGFEQLLREHIQKEDHCLFSMAAQALTAADQEKLMATFDHVEHEEMGAGTHEKYIGIADRLADRYNVERVAVAAGGHHCCGHQH
ncbi:hemerythrin domain-containing protein [bacterium]|nr:hemerythrin domain-containing protein [bacterium]